MKQIYQQVAKEFGVTPELVEHCWKHQWNFIWDNLRYPEYPAIFISHFGTFSLMPKKLNDKIEKYKQYIERHPEKERPKIKIEEIKQLHEAALKYQVSRKLENK